MKVFQTQNEIVSNDAKCKAPYFAISYLESVPKDI